jgi:hypothetical protein
MKTVTLTQEQARLVMQCLDLATKQGGLNAAAVILPVAQAIESQLTTEAASAEAVAGLSSPNPET